MSQNQCQTEVDASLAGCAATECLVPSAGRLPRAHRPRSGDSWAPGTEPLYVDYLVAAWSDTAQTHCLSVSADAGLADARILNKDQIEPSSLLRLIPAPQVLLRIMVGVSAVILLVGSLAGALPWDPRQ